MPETESEDNIHSELAEEESAREVIIRNYDNRGKDDVDIAHEAKQSIFCSNFYTYRVSQSK